MGVGWEGKKEYLRGQYSPLINGGEVTFFLLLLLLLLVTGLTSTRCSTLRIITVRLIVRTQQAQAI